MLKKPLFVSIFVLLFIGLSDYGYACHKDVEHGPHTCPEPDPPPSDDAPKCHIEFCMDFASGRVTDDGMGPVGVTCPHERVHPLS